MVDTFFLANDPFHFIATPKNVHSIAPSVTGPIGRQTVLSFSSEALLYVPAKELRHISLALTEARHTSYFPSSSRIFSQLRWLGIQTESEFQLGAEVRKH
ncbi:MAG: hypothetical protein HY011_35550 [Acidobacteria bacterium]|nr:hypothetical protein [Acidobacteriota bacterium]